MNSLQCCGCGSGWLRLGLVELSQRVGLDWGLRLQLWEKAAVRLLLLLLVPSCTPPLLHWKFPSTLYSAEPLVAACVLCAVFCEDWVCVVSDVLCDGSAGQLCALHA